MRGPCTARAQAYFGLLCQLCRGGDMALGAIPLNTEQQELVPLAYVEEDLWGHVRIHGPTNLAVRISGRG